MKGVIQDPVPTISHLITKGINCHILYVKAGFIHYALDYNEGFGNRQFQFTVPIDDAGTGLFKAEMKPVTLMRWVRKALENNELVEI
jgi:hypothetical protein